MKIALFCSSRNIIPSFKTGGTEQPIFLLAKELAKRKHQVTLYAARGSKVPGVKIKEISPFATCLKQEYLNIQERIAGFYDLAALANFFKNEANNFDIVQFNSYIFYEILPFTKWSKIPIVIRINYPHNLIYPYIKNYLKQFKNVHYLPISHFVKTIMPCLPYLEPIYPAVDTNDFKYSVKPKSYLLFIGRISSSKGAHIAIEVAKKAKKKLILAGRIDEEEPRSYFNDFIKPYLDNKKIVYVGEVDFKTKIKLYQGAQTTLFPIQEMEGFGNVQIESMACGTPVIAFDKAACREAILDKKSGFIVKDGGISQMVAAVKKVRELDRQEVRKWAVDNFSVGQYIKKHEDLFNDLIKESSNL